MRQISTTIMVAVIFMCLIGCQPPQEVQNPNRSEMLTKGIKIGELAPTNTPKKSNEVSMRVFIYELPTENRKIINDVLKNLSINYLRFTSYKTFKLNGFEAGFGRNNSWPMVGDALHRASARTASTKNLLFFDSSYNDIVAGRSFQGQAFYLNGRKGTQELVKLKEGQLLWRVSAISQPERKGVSLVQIRTLHKEEVLAAITQMPGYENTGETVFQNMDVKLNMSPGDFVVMGPAIEESDQVILSDLYYSRQGDIIVPKIEENNDKSGNKYAKIEKDIPLTRLYVFACLGVKD